MNFKTQLYINGEWRDAIKGGKFDTFNPATEEIIASVASGTAEDIDGMLILVSCFEVICSAAAVAAATACLNSDRWGYKSTGAQRAVVGIMTTVTLDVDH